MDSKEKLTRSETIGFLLFFALIALIIVGVPSCCIVVSINSNIERKKEQDILRETLNESIKENGNIVIIRKIIIRYRASNYTIIEWENGKRGRIGPQNEKLIVGDECTIYVRELTQDCWKSVNFGLKRIEKPKSPR